MADDRIDVEITDKVDSNIEKKITGIETASKAAHSSVQLLKKELASIRAGSLNTIKAAMNSNAGATLKEAQAKRSLTTESTKATAALAKEAAQRERLAGVVERAALREETANKRAAASRNSTLGGQTGSRATAAAQTAAMRAVQPSVPAVPSPAQAKAAAAATQEQARATADLAARAAVLRGTIDPLYSAQNRYNTEIREANALLSANVISEGEHARAVANSTKSLTQAKAGYGMLGNQAYQTRNRMLTLQYTAQDVAASLASGANPFTILLQQGGQVSAAFGGVGAAIRGVGAALLGLALSPVGLALGVIALAFVGIKQAAADTSEIKAYANTLGLTRDEMKQLKDVTVTFGDVASATFQVLAERAGTSAKELKEKVGGAFKSVGEFGKFSAALIYAAFFAGFRGIARIVLGLPKIVGEAMVGVVNLAIAGIEKLLNGASDGLNFFVRRINEELGTSIGDFGTVKLERMTNKFSGATKEVAAGIRDDFKGAFADANSLFDDISAKATAVSKERVKAQADAIKADRNAKKTPNAKKEKADDSAAKRAKELADINRELDTEIRLLGMVGPAREIETRYTQIVNSLLEKKITLDKAESEALRNKITTITQLAGVQQQLDRIYNEAVKPQQTYNDTLKAASQLLRDKMITQAMHDRQVAQASRTLAEATDPLLRYNEAKADENALLGLYGRELAIATEVQAKYNELRALDPTITASVLPGLRAEVIELTKKRDLQAQMSAAEGDIMAAAAPVQANEFLIANYETLYAKINQLRADDVLSEQAAMTAKADLDDRYRRARLSSQMALLDGLAGLANSSNKKLAAIGKAAAMTQATIDGILAVQKALASSPPPLNFINAAIVGVTAAMNVAKIAGFERGGFTGMGGRKEMAGVVHGREFVMNADATQRNRPLLEALNRGDGGYMRGGFVQQPTREPGSAAPAAAGAPGANVGNGQTPVADRFKIVNVMDPREALGALDTYEGEQLIVNVIERRRNDLSGILGAR